MGLLRDSLIISSSRILISVLMFLGDAVLSRYLGVVGKGEYFYIYNFIFMLAVMLTGGLEYGNLFYSRKGGLSQLLYHALIYFAGLSILLTITIPNVIDLIAEYPVKTPFIKACTVLGITLEIIFIVLLDLLLAKSKILSYVAVRIVRRTAFFIMVLTVWLSYHSSELSVSFICYLSSISISLVMLLYFLRSDFNMKLTFQKHIFFETLTYGIKTHIGKMTERLHTRSCIFLIGALSSTSNIGLYSVTIGISETLLYFSNAASLAIFSRVKNEPEQQAKDAQTVLRHVLPIAVGLSAILVFAGQYIIQVFFGSAFADAYKALTLILPGVTLYTICPIVSAYLINVGKSFLSSACSILGLGCNVVLNILLIPHHGIEGAAIAASISYTATALISLIIFIRHSQSNMSSALLLSTADIKKIKNYLVQATNFTNCR
jgi:O-antigen/teichoic acid export membrane protein